VATNAFMVYDWLELRGRCDFYVALERPAKRVIAACVVYHDVGFDSIVFCGAPKGIEAILAHLKPDKAVLPRVRPEELPSVLKALGPGADVKAYDTLLMTCDRASFRPVIAHEVVRLGPGHAGIFKHFCSEHLRRDITIGEAKRRLGDPEKPVFAVIEGGQIASVAAIYLRLPEVSFVGSVFTVPEHRNKGLATSVVSRATEEALSASEFAALLVRSDNAPALRVYGKIGYRPYRRLKWLSVGVDLRP